MTDDKSNENIHWSDRAAQQIIKDHGNKDSYTIAAGITPSGVVHIGNFREIITNDIIGRALRKMGKKVRFIYSWDDFDAFRKVPGDAPQQDILSDNLRKPLIKVPDPYGCEHESYARHHESKVEEDLPKVGISPEFIYQSKQYMSCEYVEGTKTALDQAEEIREILNKFRKEPLKDSWLPLSIYCQECWKDTVKVEEFNDYNINYKCRCGNSGTLDMRKDGYYKLLWRADWPMRWNHEKVDFEPGGKDHSTQGGSYDTGKQIVKVLWDRKAPTYVMYNFIGIKGSGGKMSSSKGNVVTVSDVLEVYTPALLRFMFAGSRPGAEFMISFDTDLLQLYDEYDRAERIYYGTEDAKNEKEEAHLKRVYELSQPFIDDIPKDAPIQPGIRHLTNLVQIFPDDIERVKEYYADEIMNEHDEARLMERAKCAYEWVSNHAPEDFRFEVQKNISEEVKSSLSGPMKESLLLLADSLGDYEDDKELHAQFYEICENTGISNRDFFKAAYHVILGKDKGPRLANLILEIGQENVKELLVQLR